MEFSLERYHRNLRGLLNLALCLILTVGFGLVASTSAAFTAESIVDSTDDSRAALLAALQMAFEQVGSTRDGAFRLALAMPMPVDQARAAINRVRMLPQVLYANIGENQTNTSTAASDATANGSPVQGPPIRGMIVKYHDVATIQAAERNEKLPAELLDRLSAMAGQPVAHEHAMSRGAYVVRLFQALPVAQAKALAQTIESDPAIEYAEPDLLKQPTLTPNDTYYSLQWHYQSPPAEMGGVNLPSAWSTTTGSTSIVVGVIDTGILPHPDLAGRYLPGYDMIADPLVANDLHDPRCLQQSRRGRHRPWGLGYVGRKYERVFPGMRRQQQLVSWHPRRGNHWRGKQ